MKLSKREKYAIYVVAALISVVLAVELLVNPFIQRRKQLERAIAVKTQTMAEISVMGDQARTIRNQASSAKARLAQRPPGFSLFSFLDGLSGQAGVKSNVAYMKPSTSLEKEGQVRVSQVEMKLKEVSLKQMATFLHMVETSENMVYVKRISIRRVGKEIKLIDATLLVETIES